MTNDKTQADSVTDLYISGEFWNEIPDFLASQAPNKVRHLMDFIDFDVILHKLPNKTVSIADIACGAGKVSTGIAKQLRERYPEYQTKVYGYDLSPQAIETAKKLNTEGEFFCRDFNDAGMSFDLALLIDVIEHVPDPDEFMQSAAKCSRFFAVSFAMDDNLANKLSTKRREATHASGHISLFDERRAVDLSKKYGKLIGATYIRNPMARNLGIKRPLHLLTILPRLMLQLLSPRLKGKVFGGESLYTIVESSIFSYASSDAPGRGNDE